jgi:arsenate reductase
MKAKIFGIPNCGSVKKARVWLQENHISEEFHDYKKLGIDEQHLKQWCEEFGWEKVLNKKGTTWRNLDEGLKSQITNEEAAIKLMVENTSVIKRPVILTEKGNTIGFDENDYNKTFLK